MSMYKIISIFVINSLLLSNQNYIRCGLIDEANNLTAFEITKDVLGGGLYKGLLN